MPAQNESVATLRGAWRKTAPTWFSRSGLIAVLLVVTVLVIQVLVGAYESERGLHSDEAAHLLNGMLLRDYLREGLGQDPVAFAREYYQRYPKIAPFMWPPLFHTTLGIALLPGWPPAVVALVLLALCTAWTAWRLYTIVLTFSSLPVALCTIALFLALPAVISLTSSVMIDIVIAAFALEAAYWLGRFSLTGQTRDGAIFGLMTALACMSKGNGLSAVLAPFVLIVVTGNYRLLARPGLYVAAAIVVALSGPPLYIAYRLDATLGDFGPLSWPLIRDRWVFYCTHVWRQLGTLPVLFALAGLVAALTPRFWTSPAARGLALGLVSMVGGAFVFHLLSPHIISHERYITLALAPLLGLTALGVMALTRIVASRPVRWSLQLAIFLVMTVTHFASRPVLAAQTPLGYRAALAFLSNANALAGQRLLVVSNEQGEGACVVEAAVLELEPPPTMLRGSKLLASDDWMGRNFALRYKSIDEMLADLEAMHVEYVLLDRSPEARTLGYWQQVHDLVTTRPDRVETLLERPVDPVHGPLRPLSLYRLKYQAPGPPKPIEFSGSSPLISGH